MKLITYIIALLCLTSLTHTAIPEAAVIDFAQLIGPDHTPRKAFDEALSSEIPLVIKFYRIHCGPCKATDAAFEKMAQFFKGKARFIKLNISKFEEIASQFPIQTVPSWAICAGKRKIAFIKGSENQLQVHKYLAKYLLEKKTTA